MSRIYQTGAEGGVADYETTGAGSGINVSTVQVKGKGNYSYIIGSPNVSGRINSGTSYGFGLPNTDNLSKFYYKSDIYIDALDESGNDLFFCPLEVKGSNYMASVFIYNDSGTLKMVVQYNSSKYYYDSGADHSSIVDLGVAFDTWFRFEVHMDTTTDAGSNIFEVKLDESSLINDTDLTFTASTTSILSMITVNISGNDNKNMISYIDNISVNDSAGRMNNTWIGEEDIIALLPDDIGDSSYSSGSIVAISQIPVSKFSSTIYDHCGIHGTGAAFVKIEDPTDYIDSDSVINAISVPAYIREQSDSSTKRYYRFGIKSKSFGTIDYTTMADAGGTTVRVSPSGTTEYGNLLISETDPDTDGRWKVTGTNSLSNAQIGIESTIKYSEILLLDIQAMVAYSPSVDESHGLLIMFW